MDGLVSKGTVVLCQWRSEVLKFLPNKLIRVTYYHFAGLSIEAGSWRKPAGGQTTLRRLVLLRYQLKRNTLCLKSLKTCLRLQEIASKQLLFSKNFWERMAPEPLVWGRRPPQNRRWACCLEYQPPTSLQSDSYSKLQ